MSTAPPNSSQGASSSKGPASSGGTGNSSHVAHHVAEFGEVSNLVHIEHENEHEKDAIPAPPISRKDKLAKKDRLNRLRGRLFAERHLMQYFHNDVLYRTEGNRSIGPDELFLDLVIVGGIAALGHELRVGFNGFETVEKFFLLFSAIYSGWRALVMLWNFWDVRSDLIDKAGIYLVFFALTGIALGAHGAFDDGIRPYVAGSAFAATAIPAISMWIWAYKEPLLKNPNNIINQIALLGATNFFSVLPYFAAAFVGTDRAARILFWIPVGIQLSVIYFTGSVYRFVHRNREGYTRLAVAIELMVEKYEVLTMIVLGESVLAILFEAAEVVTADGARVGSLYGAAAAGTAMLYCFQTMYVNIDSNIIKGGTHALRYKGLFGIIWGQLHYFYHFTLILFSTGLGISLRDIAIPPKKSVGAAEKVLEILVRAGGDDESNDGYPAFGRDERWLFSVGWGASLILSGLFAALHDSGPRVATKRIRLTIRFIVATGLMVGMPFADELSSGNFLIVFTVAHVVLTLVEYLCQQMDRMGFFRNEFSLMSSTDMTDPTDSFDDEEDEVEDTQEPRSAEDALSKESQAAADNAILTRALTQRLRKRHCDRLVVCPHYAAARRKAEAEAQAKEAAEQKENEQV